MPAEFWKTLGEEGTSEVVDICKGIYEGDRPAEFTNAVILSLAKRVNVHLGKT